jgi:hypothetical protein
VVAVAGRSANLTQAAPWPWQSIPSLRTLQPSSGPASASSRAWWPGGGVVSDYPSLAEAGTVGSRSGRGGGHRRPEWRGWLPSAGSVARRCWRGSGRAGECGRLEVSIASSLVRGARTRRRGRSRERRNPSRRRGPTAVRVKAGRKLDQLCWLKSGPPGASRGARGAKPVGRSGAGAESPSSPKISRTVFSRRQSSRRTRSALTKLSRGTAASRGPCRAGDRSRGVVDEAVDHRRGGTSGCASDSNGV